MRSCAAQVADLRLAAPKKCPSLLAHMLAKRARSARDSWGSRGADPKAGPTGCFRLGRAVDACEHKLAEASAVTAVSGQAATRVRHWRPGCR